VIPRIGFADARDPRVLAATGRVASSGRASVVLVGMDPGAVPDGVGWEVPPDGTSDVEHLAALVAAGGLAAGIAGSLTPSPDVLRAGIRHLRGADLVSACFAIGHGQKWTTYADCAVVPDPDAAQLAQIAASAADHHRQMFRTEPLVAMLSFSTAGSASHPRVALVQDATRRLRAARPDLLVDGEIQFDVAVDAGVAARKAPGSRVAGAANVLVFPSLEAANIAYKVAERVGGASALGSFVLGLQKPWVDLSRGCSVDDIVDTALLLATALVPATGAASLAG
jgi:phosphate acetyltransferase